MKDLPLPAPPTKLDWAKWGLVPAMAGIGLMGALLWGLYGKKDKKMTKLEKACIAFVIAVSEKVEELEKQKNELVKQLSEVDKKLITETARADRAENLADEKIRRTQELEATIKELESKLAVATAAKPAKTSRR